MREHPDYDDTINSIPAQYLPDELKLALVTHERGPELAYHLARNRSDLFDIASRRPEMMAAAVEFLASRIAAPQPNVPAQIPITQAPPPTPRVSGRSPTEVPSEKLTDDEWYRRRKESARKR